MKGLFVTFYGFFLAIILGSIFIEDTLQSDVYQHEIEESYLNLAETLTNSVLQGQDPTIELDQKSIEIIFSPLIRSGEISKLSILDKNISNKHFPGISNRKILANVINDEVDIVDVAIRMPDGRSLFFQFTDAYSDNYMNVFYQSRGLTVLLSFTLIFLGSIFLFNYLNGLRKSSHEIAKGNYSAKAPSSKIAVFQHLSNDINYLAKSLEDNHKQQAVLNTALHHETRVPLQRLRLALDMAISSKDYGNLDDFLADMDNDLNELTSLTEEMLMLSRLSINPESLTTELLNLEKCINEVIDEFRNQKISFNSDNNIYLTINRTLFMILIRNLVSNAEKFYKNSISITLNQTDNAIQLEVIDDGTGINEADRKTIFEPFVQANQDNKPKGFGVGLALVQQIANHSQAEISVSSSAEGGARIAVTWQL